MSVRIITDSAADLTPDIRRQVYTVAMTVHFGALHTREYVRALAAGRVMHLICGFFTDDLHTPDGLHI